MKPVRSRAHAFPHFADVYNSLISGREGEPAKDGGSPRVASEACPLRASARLAGESLKLLPVARVAKHEVVLSYARSSSMDSARLTSCALSLSGRSLLRATRDSALDRDRGRGAGDGFRIKSGSKKLMKVRSLLHRSAGCFRTFAIRPVWPWKAFSADKVLDSSSVLVQCLNGPSLRHEIEDVVG